MAPSFLKSVGAAAAAFAAHAGATQSYQVSEIYNSTNFFDKFNFYTSTDPNGGYVQFQSQSAAQDLGIVKYQDGAAYVGVDTSGGYSASGVGRKSVRLESKNVYNHGLVIADFTHLPKPVCGSWPAFWFFGAPWPTKGEVDLYENWNDLTFNRHTAHVDAPSVVGNCTLSAADMTATIDSPNCYDFAAGQYDYQGCSASEYSSNFGSSSGGIYAMEWTSDYIKIWDWSRTGAPSDILSGKPSPSSLWGTPSYAIEQCNIDKAFKDMNMVLNIDFCGVAGQTDKWGLSCQAETGYSTCAEYVAQGDDDFADVYFQVEDIKIYQLEDVQNSTSSAVSSTSGSSVLSSSATTSGSVSVATTSSVTYSNSSSTISPAASSTASDDDDDTCTDDEGESSSSFVASSTASVSATTTGSSGSSLVTGGASSTSGQTTAAYPSGNSYAVSSPSSEAAEYTTSTIYTTSVHTVTSCAATVTNCPARGYVTTEIISIGTTVCPVTASGSSPEPTTTASIPEGYTTSTVEVTKTYTITSCKPTVTNCPVGAVTTEISITTTVCPIGSSGPSSSSGQPAGSTGTAGQLVGSTGVTSQPETGSTVTSGASASYPVVTGNAATPSTAVSSGSSGSSSGSGGSSSGSSGSSSSGNSSGSDSSNSGSGSGSGSGSSSGSGNSSSSNSSSSNGSSSGSGSGSSSGTDVFVTATVYPISSGKVSYNATLTASVANSASAVATGNTGASTSSVVEISAGVKTSASFALAGVAAFFFFAM